MNEEIPFGIKVLEKLIEKKHEELKIEEVKNKVKLLWDREFPGIKPRDIALVEEDGKLLFDSYAIINLSQLGEEAREKALDIAKILFDRRDLSYGDLYLLIFIFNGRRFWPGDILGHFRKIYGEEKEDYDVAVYIGYGLEEDP